MSIKLAKTVLTTIFGGASLVLAAGAQAQIPSPANSDPNAFEVLQYDSGGGTYVGVTSGTYTFSGETDLTDPLGLNPTCIVDLTGDVELVSGGLEITVTGGTINPGDSICDDLTFDPSTFPWDTTFVPDADSPADAAALDAITGSFSPVEVLYLGFIAVCGRNNAVTVDFQNGPASGDANDPSFFSFNGASIGSNCSVTGELSNDDVNAY